MSLDERYVRGVSSLSPMFVGGNPARGPMDSAPNRVQRAFCTSTRSRSPSRILLAQDRPLSQIENRRRSHPHRWACAKRVHGAFTRRDDAPFSPPRPYWFTEADWGDRAILSQFSTRREKESPSLVELK